MAIFNEDMAARVKAFQQVNGLAATGVVSQETWEILLLDKPPEKPQKLQELQESDPAKEAGEVMLPREEFSLTYEIATLTTEDAVKDFFKGRGIDLDAIVAYGEAIERIKTVGY